jgi:hypothetical protein
MYKASDESPQIKLFTSGVSLFSGKSLNLYQDNNAWHNQFRSHVTMRVDESLFECLYDSRKGTPNASIRVLIGMMILKEAEGLSDQKIFESCRFNMLTRSALGLVNADDPVPTESTYYLFRKKVREYAEEKNENLFDTVFASITKQQSLEFDISGKRIRMDSKLLGSNIAWLSRYELVHETLRVFYRKIEKTELLDCKINEQLEEVLKFKGNKVVYTSSSDEIKTKLHQLGILISKVLPIFSSSKSVDYLTLKRVFHEQFKMDEEKLAVPRNKEEISAKSVQSPHDTDSDFRNKDGNKIKGYSINVTESCDDDKKLNLIGAVAVKKVTTSDVDFFQQGVQQSEEVFVDKVENIHADGAYHSPDNQVFCSGNEIDLHLHAIQGAKGRYQLRLSENGDLLVFDKETNAFMNVVKTKGKDSIDKWRIKVEKGYRYFTQKEIDTCTVRQKIEETPTEILQKRNNVEATIFQLGYHYPNAKSRYRGLIKHQMWADMRCLWVNFVRVLKFIKNKPLNISILKNYLLKNRFDKLIIAFKIFLSKESELIFLIS